MYIARRTIFFGWQVLAVMWAGKYRVHEAFLTREQAEEMVNRLNGGLNDHATRMSHVR